MSRLTDSDKKYGPLTVGKTDWKAFRLIYSTEAGEDYPEEKGNNITFYFNGFVARLSLPEIIKPYSLKIYPKELWDEATVKRLGRDHYFEYFNREYGFSYSENFLQIFYGIQRDGSMYDQVPEKSKSWFLPWGETRMTKYEIYNARGLLVWKDKKATGESVKNEIDSYQVVAAMQTKDFVVMDYDGKEIFVKTYISIREWKHGTGLFKWLSWFKQDIISKRLEIEFTSEVGPSKSDSWKGGLIGTSIEILGKETMEDAFKRYCSLEHYDRCGKYKITYVGLA